MSDTSFTSSSQVRVRYAETDAQRIVHHASYIVYFEVARSDLIRSLGMSYADFESEGFFLAVSDVAVRYLRPARYDDLLTVHCGVKQARSRSLTFVYAIENATTGQQLVTGETKHICLDATGQVARVPERWLNLFV